MDTGNGNVTLIKHLLENTALNAKSGKIIGTAFKTNVGVPQEDGLSPRLFTLYLVETLKVKEAEIRSGINHNYARQSSDPPIHLHDYSKSKIPLRPSHPEHADHVGFF